MSQHLGTWGRGSGKKETEKKAIIGSAELTPPARPFLSPDMIRFQDKPV